MTALAFVAGSLAYVGTVYLYAFQAHFFFGLLAALAFLLFRKWPMALAVTLAALLLFALHAVAMQPLASFISRWLPVHFPSMTAQNLLACIYGAFLSFFVRQSIRISLPIRALVLLQILVLMGLTDVISYSKILFVLQNLLLANLTLLALAKEKSLVLKMPRAVLVLPLVTLAAGLTLSLPDEGRKSIYIVEDSAVWATDTGAFDTSDWTLTTAYSYSLMNQFLAKKHEVVREPSLARLVEIMPDVLFYMTPTKPFTNEDRETMNAYLNEGGHIVFVADHTDLYGHARVINAFVEEHGLKLNYDAVYNPADRNTPVSLNERPMSSLRPLTGCSVDVRGPAFVRSSFWGFIAEDADYTKPNFFAEMHFTPEDVIGVFPLFLSKRALNGVVTICTDSTLFSNFAIFTPSVLPLLDDLFRDVKIPALVCLVSFWGLALCIFLLFTPVRENAVFFPVLLVLAFVGTLSWVMRGTPPSGFYDESRELVVQAERDGLIYERTPPLDERWKETVSNLMVNLPRFGFYPRYANTLDRLLGTSVDLHLVANNPRNPDKDERYASLARTGGNASVFPLGDRFSDFYLGNWWNSIGISPFRHAQFVRFATWVGDGKLLAAMDYPSPSLTGEGTRLTMRNGAGQSRELDFAEVTYYAYENELYVYLGNGLWGIYKEDAGDHFLTGGPNFNDNDAAADPFFSLFWIVQLDEIHAPTNQRIVKLK